MVRKEGGRTDQRHEEPEHDQRKQRPDDHREHALASTAGGAAAHSTECALRALAGAATAHGSMAHGSGRQHAWKGGGREGGMEHGTEEGEGVDRCSP